METSKFSRKQKPSNTNREIGNKQIEQETSKYNRDAGNAAGTTSTLLLFSLLISMKIVFLDCKEKLKDWSKQGRPAPYGWNTQPKRCFKTYLRHSIASLEKILRHFPFLGGLNKQL